MKRLVILLFVLGSVNLVRAQASKKSASMSFNYTEQGTKISGVSNVLSFVSTANQSKISAVSNVLSFTNSNRKSAPVEINTASTPLKNASVADVVKEQSTPPVNTAKPEQKTVAQNQSRQPEQNRTVGVEEVKPKAVKIVGTKELGEEYVSSTPKYRALIFGVSDYKYAGSGLPTLTNPTIDAQKLYTLLTSKYAFDTANVKYIKNPTRKQIIDAFEALSYDVSEKENLLVFYAGHGYYDKDKEFGYWLPSDARASSRSDWIPNSTIKDYLTAIKAKHTLLITDACFGGSIFKTRSVEANTIMRVHDLYKDPSRKAITSGNLSEVPDKSPFLEFLLKKLNENEDKYLPAQQLFSRIFEPVSNNSSATPQFGVIQGAGDQGGDFIFIKKD